MLTITIIVYRNKFNKMDEKRRKTQHCYRQNSLIFGMNKIIPIGNVNYDKKINMTEVKRKLITRVREG